MVYLLSDYPVQGRIFRAALVFTTGTSFFLEKGIVTQLVTEWFKPVTCILVVPKCEI